MKLNGLVGFTLLGSMSGRAILKFVTVVVLLPSSFNFGGVVF